MMYSWWLYPNRKSRWRPYTGSRYEKLRSPLLFKVATEFQNQTGIFVLRQPVHCQYPPMFQYVHRPTQVVCRVWNVVDMVASTWLGDHQEKPSVPLIRLRYMARWIICIVLYWIVLLLLLYKKYDCIVVALQFAVNPNAVSRSNVNLPSYLNR